ncbi:GTP-binding protein [Alphaproteobacteria bacterium]|nr:GTP-binding protein [bacterium]MDC0147364.1 GTP-binding protein [Alphaproteobacteria bacterium]
MGPSSIPVSIISGFLGSGKTSLLNHLLAHAGGRKLAALVNDFGALNIDSELIAAQNGNQISLANGCVCCSIGDDLTLALAELMRQDERPDHILIEASGVADPARIAGFTQVDRELRLDAILTLVDASAHQTHANDPYLADNYDRQIKAAHFLLLSKTDLISQEAESALQAQLTARRPNVPIATMAHGVFDPDILLGRNETSWPTNMAPISHDFRHWSGHIPADLSRQELCDNLASLAPHLLRAKGVLRDPEGAYVLHFAGGNISIHDIDAEPSGHFVLIGKPELTDDETLSRLFKKQ